MHTPKRGKFITVEGVEGGGKSSNIHFLSQYLGDKGIDVIVTREPGGTDVAEAIRHVLLDVNLPSMHENTELLLMFAARAEHLQTKILPALAAGKWVISDRFTDATYAYQGGGRGVSLSKISALENWVQGDLRPDYTLLFDLDVELGLQRTRQRGAADRFEQEQVEFFQRIRESYLQMAEKESKRFYQIDAAQSLDKVQQQLIYVIDQLLDKY